MQTLQFLNYAKQLLKDLEDSLKKDIDISKNPQEETIKESTLIHKTPQVYTETSSNISTINKTDAIKNNSSQLKTDNFFTVYKKDNESVQDYVKRIFTYLMDNNMLTEYDLQQLQNRDYCSQVFNIDFPLLIINEQDISIKGHDRYWRKFKLANKYYMCNHWWKSKFPIYIPLIEKYVQGVINRKTL